MVKPGRRRFRKRAGKARTLVLAGMLNLRPTSRLFALHRQAGDRLPPERDLAEILGVSRASLRGALKAFQVMGVLEVRQGSGNYLSAEATQILEQPARTLVPLPNLSQFPAYSDLRSPARSNNRHRPSVGEFTT